MAGLENQVVLIPGGSSGIGRALSRGFADTAAQGMERFSEDSLFRSVADAIEARSRTSETNPTVVEVVAGKVVKAASPAKPPAVLRVGYGSWRVPAIGRLPVRIRDRIFSRGFGLGRLLE